MKETPGDSPPAWKGCHKLLNERCLAYSIVTKKRYPVTRADQQMFDREEQVLLPCNVVIFNRKHAPGFH